MFDLCPCDPCGRGGVRERPGARTRSGETAPARHPVPAAVQAAADTGGVVRPPWILRNPPRAARAGALTRSAVASEAGAQSLPPTVLMRPAGPGWRAGWARQ